MKGQGLSQFESASITAQKNVQNEPIIILVGGLDPVYDLFKIKRTMYISFANKVAKPQLI